MAYQRAFYQNFGIVCEGYMTAIFKKRKSTRHVNFLSKITFHRFVLAEVVCTKYNYRVASGGRYCWLTTYYRGLILKCAR